MKLCITGTPGTGKTSVAKFLSKLLGWRIVQLNVIVHEKRLYKGYDKKRGIPVIDMESIKKEAEKIKGNVILESHYAHDMPCDVIVVLRTNPAELRKRGKKLGWKKEKIEENVEAEIMEICKQEAVEKGKEVIEIDTTGKKPIEVSLEIAKILKEKGFM